VSSGAAQVEQASLSQHNHTVAVGEDEAVTLGLDVLALDACRNMGEARWWWLGGGGQ
jgi:hypothetical protein